MVAGLEAVERLSQRWPLKFRLGLTLGAASILLAVGQATVDHYLVDRTLIKDAGDEIGDAAIRAADALGRSALILRDGLHAPATFAIGTRPLRPGSSQEVAYLKEVLESLRRQTPHVAWIGITSVKGNLIVGTGNGATD